MLNKQLRSSLPKLRAALFSTSNLAQSHKKTHYGAAMHPRFYENVFEPTSIEELEFVRSPFYELAQLKHTESGEEA